MNETFTLILMIKFITIIQLFKYHYLDIFNFRLNQENPSKTVNVKLFQSF